MRFNQELVVPASRAEIERRLFAMMEWMGYRATSQLPSYSFERGVAGSALISLSPRSWHSTFNVTLQEAAGGTQVALQQKVSTSGQIKSRLDRALFENEMHDLAQWLERLEPPKIDRKRQNTQAMWLSAAYTAILIAIPLALYFSLRGLPGIIAAAISLGVMFAIWPLIPFRPTARPLEGPGPVVPPPPVSQVGE